MGYKIYRGDEVVAEGNAPLKIGGLDPGTTYKKGMFQIVEVIKGKETERVDLPSFTTQEIVLSPQTSRAKSGKAGSRVLTTNYESGVRFVAERPIRVTKDGKISWAKSVKKGTYETQVMVNGKCVATHTLTLE